MKTRKKRIPRPAPPRPGETMLRLAADIQQAYRELIGAKRIAEAVDTLAKEQPDRYGQLVADITAVLGRGQETAQESAAASESP